MPRKPRIEFPGAVYHVFARGNRKQLIFYNKSDYVKYLHLVYDYKERYMFHVYAYALMPNHIHLLIETNEIPLSVIMQGLQQSYTQYFNLKHNQVGHVFQGRYKASLCDKDSYLLELVRYIHLNPIRAGLAVELFEYPWTGHKEYEMRPQKAIIDAGYMLEYFGPSLSEARKYYAQFIKDGLKDNNNRTVPTFDYTEGTIPTARGEYTTQLKTKTRNRGSISLDLDMMITIICDRFRVMPQEIRSAMKSPDTVLIRRLLCYFARTMCCMLVKDIAANLKIGETTVSKSIIWVTSNMRKNAKVKKMVENINAILSENV